jgi:glutamate N-acetyltransferase/amino-acid N-acetyltransferase
MTHPSPIPTEALPRGFRFAAVKAGIKPSGKPDFAVAVAPRIASAAAMFTKNRVQAAPIVIGRRHLERSEGLVRAVVVNAGNANCATGEAGFRAAEQVCAAAAKTFGCEPHQVLPSSTGIIGVPLPSEKLVAALPDVQRTLAATPEAFAEFANAILTTDTRAKIAHTTLDVNGKQVRLAGVCKGAGMIHPQLASATAPLHATMLVYLFTDAALHPTTLDRYLRAATEASFNRISIDGDTSTNDTVLMLCSGESGVDIWADDPDFEQALTELCISLGKQIVGDGEGITHVVELQIQGAATNDDAVRVARAIANSPLVKTAWAGTDPHWGRRLAAAGRSGADIDPARLAVWFGNLPICVNGGRAPQYDEKAAHQYLTQREFSIRISLGDGPGCCRFWTSDLTAEYVRINAEYST